MIRNAAGRPALEAFLRLVRRRAGIIVVLTLLASLALAAALPRLEVYNPSEKYDLPADDPVAAEARRLQALFGEPVVVLVGIDFDRALDLQALRLLDRLSGELAALDGVTDVSSLATASWIYLQNVPPLVGRLFDNRTADSAGVQRLVRFASRQPLYAETLLGGDGRSAAILVEIQAGGRDTAEKLRHERALVGRIRGLLEAERAGFHAYHLAGLPLIDLAFEANLKRDLGVFGLLGALLSLGILVFLFRAWRPVALACALALLSLVWALGVLALTRTPLSLGLSMLVPLVLVLSIAYSVHYLTVLFRADHRDAAPAELVERMLRTLLPPSLLTGLTTACGFAALNASGLQGIREVGTYLAVGVLACMFMSSVFLPALLFRVPALIGGKSRMGGHSAALARFLGGLVVGRTPIIIAAAVVLGLLAVPGLLRLRVDSNHLFYFHPDEPVRRDYAFVDARFGGAVPLEILVRRPIAQLNETLDEIRRLTAELRPLDGLGSVTSLADLTDRAGTDRGPRLATFSGPARLPPSAWERVAGSAFGRGYLHLDDGTATLRVRARARVQGTQRLQALLHEVRAHVDTHLPDTEVVITGMLPVFVRTLDYILRSQVQSFALAFFVIFGILSLLARSWRLGAITVLANALPVLLVLGAMGWLRIPLDIATVMIASVVIGIAVDDTIHFLYRFRRESAAVADVEAAVVRTFREVGTPLVVSSLVFSGGFLVLVPSGFVPIRYFGLLSGLTVLAALVGDLLLLPALLKALRGRY